MGDPNYTSVSLLCHCDGADEGTTFTDDGPVGHTLTANGSANTEQSDFKWGTASGEFAWGTSAYVSCPDHASLDFGSGDFTIEMWVKDDGTSSDDRWLLSRYDPGGIGAFKLRFHGGTNLVTFWASSNNSTYDIANNVSVGTVGAGWDHIAVTREGSTWSLYINGSRTSTFSSSSSIWSGSSSALQFGGYSSSGSGLRVDDIRLTKGVARYTGASYTVPTEAFPNNSGGDLSVTGDVAIEVGVDSPVEFILTQRGTDTAIEVGVDSPVAFQSSVRPSDTAIEVGVDSPVYFNTSTRAGDVAIEVGVDSPVEFETGNYIPGTITTTLPGPVVADMQGRTASGFIVADLAGIITTSLSGFTAPAGVITAPLTVITASLAGGERAIEALLPSPITAQLDGYAAVAGAITTQLPRQYALLSGYVQGTGAISARLRRVRASLAGYIVPTGSIDVELPLIKGLLGGAQAAIGSITAELPEPIEALLEGYLQVSGTVTAKLTRIEPWILAERQLAYLRTYAMNTNTKALVEFNAFDFASMTEYKGQVLGLKADGLYKVGGATDNGAPIAALVESGLVDYKVPQIKRMSEMYFSGAVDGRLKISCQVEQRGPFYSYYLADDGVDTIRQRKVNIGKGLRGRYWKVRIENVDGADFAFDDITVNYGQTRRKVGA